MTADEAPRTDGNTGAAKAAKPNMSKHATKPSKAKTTGKGKSEANGQRLGDHHKLILLQWLQNKKHYDACFGSAGKTVLGRTVTKRQGFKLMGYHLAKMSNFKLEAKAMTERWGTYCRQYKKAKAMSQTTGSGITKADERKGINTIQKKLESICAHFELFDRIFGKQRSVRPVASLDTCDPMEDERSKGSDSDDVTSESGDVTSESEGASVDGGNDMGEESDDGNDDGNDGGNNDGNDDNGGEDGGSNITEVGDQGNDDDNGGDGSDDSDEVVDLTKDAEFSRTPTVSIRTPTVSILRTPTVSILRTPTVCMAFERLKATRLNCLQADAREPARKRSKKEHEGRKKDENKGNKENARKGRTREGIKNDERKTPPTLETAPADHRRGGFFAALNAQQQEREEAKLRAEAKKYELKREMKVLDIHAREDAARAERDLKREEMQLAKETEKNQTLWRLLEMAGGDEEKFARLSRIFGY